MTENRVLIVVAGWLLGLSACGGLAEGGVGPDGAADRSAPPSEAASDSDTSTTLDSGGPQDAAVDVDGGLPVAGGLPFVDAGFFASCDADPCGYEQFCLNTLPFPGDLDAAPIPSSCASIPPTCEPNPTCMCVIKNAGIGLCKCVVQSGKIVLTCYPPP